MAVGDSFSARGSAHTHTDLFLGKAKKTFWYFGGFRGAKIPKKLVFFFAKIPISALL